MSMEDKIKQTKDVFLRKNQRLTKNKYFLYIAPIIFLIFIIFLLKTSSMFRASKKTAHAQITTVVATKPHLDNIPVFLNALGSVTPKESITVKTQVNGILEKILFKEGEMIKAGNLLAQIDSRQFLAQLQQYEGQLLKDKALLTNAQIDLARYRTLWQEDSIAKQILDTQQSLVRQLEGTVKSDLGLVNSAKTNLAFTKIMSPINGRLGLQLVDPGNYIQTNDPNGLFVINTIHPITVIFSLPEDNIPEILTAIKKNKKMLVEAYDRAQNHLLATGFLLTIDNQIDPATGTIKLKAQFDNQDNHLFPNQFVNIRLKVNELKKAVLVPSTGVLHGKQGDYVFVVDLHSKIVQTKLITVQMIHEENTVIKKGISAEESIVIEGTDKLTNGSVVNFRPLS